MDPKVLGNLVLDALKKDRELNPDEFKEYGSATNVFFKMQDANLSGRVESFHIDLMQEMHEYETWGGQSHVVPGLKKVYFRVVLRQDRHIPWNQAQVVRISFGNKQEGKFFRCNAAILDQVLAENDFMLSVRMVVIGKIEGYDPRGEGDGV